MARYQGGDIPLAVPSAPRIIRFGVFAVDLQAGELHKNGVKVRLQEQPFQILSLLLEHPGRVVTREEIQQQLWPEGTFVDFEHSLNAAVKRLREALGDSADNPQFVETVPRRGYRFIYSVEGAQARRRPWVWALALAALPALLTLLLALNVGHLRDRLLGRPLPREITSIAVLPCENLSGDPQQEYFAAGIHEALITDLAKLSGLKKVIARTSMTRYQGTDKPLPEIADELGVDAVITCSVLREGDRVRITVQLINAHTEEHLWAERYERDLRDVLSLQNEIVSSIARQIEVALAPAEATRLAEARQVDPEAYEAFLKGRFHALKYSPEDFNTALQYFQLATEKDPNYARAYTGIAFVWGLLGHFWMPGREAWPKQKAAALKAIGLDDTLAEAHEALAQHFWVERDWSAAQREFERAIELDPRCTDWRQAYYYFLAVRNRLEEAVAEIHRCLDSDPLNPRYHSDLAWMYLFRRRYGDAIAQFQKVLKTEPNWWDAHQGLWQAFHMKGMYDEAFTEAKNFYAALGDSRVVAVLESGQAEGGYREAMRRAAVTLAARSEQTYVKPWSIASVYAYAGDKDRALEWLEKAYQEGASYLVFLRLDPLYDPLRSDPRFQDLVRRMDFPE
jgi:TolB-like protein/DNA-binding winged helix-turn-helix (wHTH) protein